MSKRDGGPYSSHKARSKAAHRLLDSSPEPSRPTLEAAAELGFSDPQAARLVVLFGDRIPIAAEQLLSDISGASSSTRAFQTVSAALDLRDRREDFDRRQVERSGSGGWVYETVSNEDQSTTGTSKEERFETWLSSLLEKAESEGRCRGWEIDEVTAEGGQYGVQVGIYPWGKTIYWGSKRDWERLVNEILDEIRASTVVCPSCRAGQSSVLLDTAGWACECGTRFFVRHGYTIGNGIEGEDCWERLSWVLLHSGKNYRESKAAVERVKNGHDLDEVFEGAFVFRPFHSVIYAVAPEARPRPFSSLGTDIRFDDALFELGFQRYCSEGRYRTEVTWYEGDLDGEKIVVVLAPRLVPGPGNTSEADSPDLQMGMRRGADILYGGIHTDDEQDGVTEVWGDSDSVTLGEWKVWDAIAEVPNEHFPLSAQFIGSLPYEGSLDETVTWLRETLSDGVRACLSVAEDFLVERDRLVAEWVLRHDAYRLSKKEKRASDKAQLAHSARAWGLVGPPYRLASGGKKLGRTERSDADRILSKLAEQYGRSDVSAFLYHNEARNLFSNGLLADLRRKWIRPIPSDVPGNGSDS